MKENLITTPSSGDIWDWIKNVPNKKEILQHERLNGTQILNDSPSAPLYTGIFTSEPTETLRGSVRGSASVYRFLADSPTNYDRLIQMLIPEYVYSDYVENNRRYALRLQSMNYTGAGINLPSQTYNSYSSLPWSAGKNSKLGFVYRFIFYDVFLDSLLEYSPYLSNPGQEIITKPFTTW